MNTGQHDQMTAATKEMADCIGRFYKGCLENGFDKKQAFILSLELARALFIGIREQA